MTDEQHGEGTTPQSGGRWDPLPQGDYDDGATAFVKLPEGGIDALLASTDSPLAARGHGYVPPQITPTPGADPAAPGAWAAPADAGQWPDPGAVPQGAGNDQFTYNPAATQHWTYEEPRAPEAAPAPGHDVTGQWSIPVADGDLPDESGEFTTSSLVQQWGGTPPATLPGGASAPWATGAAGQPWGQQDTEGEAGQPHEAAAGAGIAPGQTFGGQAGVGHTHGAGPATEAERPHETRPGTGHAHVPAPETGQAHGHTGEFTVGAGHAHEATSGAGHPRAGATPGRPTPDTGTEHATPDHTPAHGTGYAPGHQAERSRTPQSPTADHTGRPGTAGHTTAAPRRPLGDGPSTDGAGTAFTGEHATDGAGTAFRESRATEATGGPLTGEPGSGNAAQAHTAEHVTGGTAEAHTADPSAPFRAAEHTGSHASASDAAVAASQAAHEAREAAGVAAGAQGAAEAAERAVEALAGASEGVGGGSGARDAEESADPQTGPAAVGSGSAGPDGSDSAATSARPDSDAGQDGSTAADTPDTAEDQGPPPSGEEHPLASYVLRVNGVERPVSDAWIGESLLYVLRERLGLAGAKDGCSQGECGACNVQVDGRLVASCLVPAVTAAGSEVRTVEGLAEDGRPSDVQRALARCGAVQCGFCVPGMAMTVHDLLEGNPAPTELETRQALCGNLCRCSGYRGVVDAVQEVVAEREAHADAEHDGDEARIPHQAGPGAGGVHASAFEAPGAMNPGPAGRHDQAYGQDGGQA
ncbi:2Fe-2S iron-sulfur cluster-binding protein [Streptomyces sp. NPDC005648]|uniref:2Fe-2S iron-sulfur cluster-binding protein n=1 Tax=Streptomyces sp. NPDC005648 TaxID=3157044 RepID=UPI0033B961CF